MRGCIGCKWLINKIMKLKEESYDGQQKHKAILILCI